VQSLLSTNQMADPYTDAEIAATIGRAIAAAGVAHEIYEGGKSVYKTGKKSLSAAQKFFKPARKMAKSYNPFTRAGRAGIGSLERKAGFRKAKRPPLRRGAAPRRGTRPVSMYEIAKKSRKFRKAAKPIVDNGKTVKRNYDDYGTIERDHSLWIGFQHHGSRGRLFDIIGEAVCKSTLAKLKIYPRSYDEVITSHDYTIMSLFFERVTNAGQDEQTTAVVGINGRTFKDIAADVANALEAQANADTSVAPASDTVARYLTKIDLYNNVNPAYGLIQIKDVGDSLVSVKVQQKIRFQNITKNVDGNLNLDQGGLNPIKGRKYVFANYRPRLIEQLQETHSTYGDFQYSDPLLTGPIDSAPGIMPMPATGSLTKDDPLCHPPIANQVFKNCKASAAISIGAGGMKHEFTTFTITHKLKSLIERIYYAGFEKGAFGGCTWFGFEKAYRQAQPPGASNDDRLSVGFNREVHMYASCKFRTQKSMLKHYDASDIGLIAAA